MGTGVTPPLRVAAASARASLGLSVSSRWSSRSTRCGHELALLERAHEGGGVGIALGGVLAERAPEDVVVHGRQVEVPLAGRGRSSLTTRYMMAVMLAPSNGRWPVIIS